MRHVKKLPQHFSLMCYKCEFRQSLATKRTVANAMRRNDYVVGVLTNCVFVCVGVSMAERMHGFAAPHLPHNPYFHSWATPGGNQAKSM